MARAYTRRLSGGMTGNGAWIYSGPVPSGKIWVVRCVDAVGDGQAVRTFAFGVSNSAQFKALVFEIWQGTTSTTGEWAISWRGRQVLNAGEYLAVYGSNSMHHAISGYELLV